MSNLIKEKDQFSLVDQLAGESELSRGDLKTLIDTRNDNVAEYLFEKAREVRHAVYGRDIFIRGLVEFTNYCKNDCYYCGIRKSNLKADRYRLTPEQILDCCAQGYELGFRTFVLQGGEDPHYTDDLMTLIVTNIKSTFPDCAVTLSLGERSKESYLRFFKAGADRYLLRHETRNEIHYASLHPAAMSLRDRLRCLSDLRDIGYQVGCGFMVGSPGQTTDCLVDDLMFIKEFGPHMVGIGPFIPHQDTPLSGQPAGTLELTVFLLGIIRLLEPRVLLPATTALGTISPTGRELGVMAGANVVMPNLSPVGVRKKYLLYDNKICTGDEAAECRFCIQRRMANIGYHIAISRGDHAALQFQTSRESQVQAALAG
ncbi:MAG: [FeFe] hydrogenase H-cluster radical SAM maturase HydE [Deltaproteobacteria bacterium]|jgi:biotin synthase|nr:[FeFe] hydrogenase H-cluster radical SAM maturase HydE [Deltaproteobacteria bacterium]